MQREFVSFIKNNPDNLEHHWKGARSNSEVRSFMMSEPVDLFLNLSQSEGLPVSIMEAMASGIPAMATDVGGTSEIVTNRNGWLLPGHPTLEIVVAALKDAISNDCTLRQKSALAQSTWRRKYEANTNYMEFCRRLITL